MKTSIRNRYGVLTTTALLALSSVSHAQFSAPPPPVTQHAVAKCESRIAGNTRKSRSDPEMKVYGPQAGWTILSYNVVDLGEFGTEVEGYTSAPAGNFVSHYDMANAYQSAFNLAVTANIPSVIEAEITTALTTSYNQSSSYNASLSSSFGNITLNTNAWGQGLFQGGSYAGLSLDVVLMQVEPCMQNAAAFRSFIMTWTTNAIAAAKKKATGIEWARLLASCHANFSRGLLQIEDDSNSLQQGVPKTRNFDVLTNMDVNIGRTMDWQDYHPRGELVTRSLVVEGGNTWVSERKKHTPVRITALTKEEVLAEIKAIIAAGQD